MKVIQQKYVQLIGALSLVMLMSLSAQQCSIISARQNLKNCKFSIENLSIQKLTLAGAELGLDIGLENTNPTEVILDRLDLVVFLDGKDIGFARNKNRVEVPAGEKRLVKFQINTTYSQLGAGLLTALKSKNEIPYQLKGTAYLQFPIVGELSFPVDVQDKVQLKK